MRLHPHEHERLESLRSYHVLDTPAEAAYDAITRAASLLCRAPIAVISLLDANRQWFKSVVGVSYRETSREVSVCNEVVAGERPLVVEDLRLDQRYRCHPQVAAGSRVRAFAGVPLIGREGLPLGALCVLDDRVRDFSDQEIEGLEVLAEQVVAHFDQRRGERAEAFDPSVLRRALDRDELRVHYQPLVDLCSGETLGFEALVRWAHPERGLLLPGTFMPSVESSGLIEPLGRFVLRDGLRTLARLHANPAFGGLTVAVNVSGVQLEHPGLAAETLRLLEQHGVPAGRLCLEITETAPILDTVTAHDELALLRDAGVQIALDDYGAGWSALSRVLDLPLTALKLDRSIVVGLPTDARAKVVARSTISLAADLGLEVICEGVETAEQRDLLIGKGATMGQGWLFSPALDPEELTAHLDAHQPSRSTFAMGQRRPALPSSDLLDALLDATAVLDAFGTITQVNHAWRMFGLDNGGDAARTGVGVNYLEVCDRAAAEGCEDAAIVAEGLRAVLEGRSVVEREAEYPCPSPTVGRWFLLRMTPLRGARTGALVSHVNTTRRKGAELELERRARLDPLTGLANRSFLEERLEVALGREVSCTGILFLDLDGFKTINDSFGHAAGDEVLLEIARRLRAAVRPQDTVSRHGGDEFTVLAEDITAEELRRLRERVCRALRRPLQVHGVTVSVGVSVGAHLAEPAEAPADALSAADRRMYDNKRCHRSRAQTSSACALARTGGA